MQSYILSLIFFLPVLVQADNPSYQADLGIGTNTINGSFEVEIPDSSKGMHQLNFEAEKLVNQHNEIITANGSYYYCYQADKCVTLHLDYKQYFENGELIERTLRPGIGFFIKPLNSDAITASVAVYSQKEIKASLETEIPVALYTTVQGAIGCEGEYCKDLEVGF